MACWPALPARLGLDPAAFERDRAAPETRARHDGLLEEAAARGAFGVPTFFLGERMFWGNDRLVLLEAALGAHPMPPPHARGRGASRSPRPTLTRRYFVHVGILRQRSSQRGASHPLS